MIFLLRSSLTTSLGKYVISVSLEVLTDAVVEGRVVTAKISSSTAASESLAVLAQVTIANLWM